MALTGLEIYKNLPKTNCKDCGFPTCLAFAMKIATKQVALDKCPHVTAAAAAALESAARPPIQLVVIGTGGGDRRPGGSDRQAGLRARRLADPRELDRRGQRVRRRGEIREGRSRGG